jgi:DNA-binding GntR family transcriptional regulator
MAKKSDVETLSPIASEPRRQKVAQVLRDAIVSGAYPSGHRLVEFDLAEQLGTSRATVREAMRQLEQEGLIASFPYRGSEVLGISQEEIEQVLVPIRLVIERFAFTRAAPNLTDDDFAHLEGLIREMHDGAVAADPDRVAEADVRFHEYVIERSDQPHCLQIWRTILPRVRAHFRRDAPAYESVDAIADQHRPLLEALRSGDTKRITDVVDEHIQTYFGPSAVEV